MQVHEVRARIDQLGLPVSALCDLFGASESAIHQWMSGDLAPEQADVLEVALSILEIRAMRATRRNEKTQVLAAIA